jgi:hypothetical protein
MACNCCTNAATDGEEMIDVEPAALRQLTPTEENADSLTVEIEKGGAGNYGAYLDKSDGKYLVVYGVAAGAVADYNKSAEPSKQLMKSDFIVSVNGKSSSEDCLMQFREEPKVTCIVMRGYELSFVLERENLQTPLGLVFPTQLKKEGYGLPIVDLLVTQGAAKEYNRKCATESDKLRPYDRIISIEGETGPPLELKAKMEKATGSFEFIVLRASENGYDPEMGCFN